MRHLRDHVEHRRTDPVEHLRGDAQLSDHRVQPFTHPAHLLRLGIGIRRLGHPSPPSRSAGPQGSAADELAGQVRLDLGDRDPLLGHCVTLAHGDGLVLEGVEVDGHAVRGADLVLTTVALADRLCVVEVHVPVLAQLRRQLLGLRGEVLVARQRQHRGLHRREARVELQHRTLVDATLGIGRLVLDVRVGEEGHQRAGQAGRRLDDVRRVVLTLGLVEVLQDGAGVLGVGAQVEVGAVGHALQLAPVGALETEPVLDVDGALRVVGELLLGVLVEPQVGRVDAELDVPLVAVVDPVLVPLLVGPRLDEELHLHLLELAGAEDEVAGGDLVAEGLAHLADTERRLLARRGHHVLEVDEDALGGLGAQVVQAGLILDRAEIGLQHHVEVPRLGPLALDPAVGAVDLGQCHLVGIGDVMLGGVVLLQVVGPQPLVAGEALGERVGEHPHVTGGHPDLTGQDDRRVQADDVLAPGDHPLPPLALDVLLQLDAVGSVVPGRPRATVDLAAGENEAAPLGEGNDIVELARGHVFSLRLSVRGHPADATGGQPSRPPPPQRQTVPRGTLSPSSSAGR
ncbi:hypothetical protein SDC9_61947 [bioreactor metagenome]|uniref:Uncharacterized protein n=1 Tax=bioreactor metagenome TaxID=1076179 RepID=A0A644XH97_9ZZZZ